VKYVLFSLSYNYNDIQFLMPVQKMLFMFMGCQDNFQVRSCVHSHRPNEKNDATVSLALNLSIFINALALVSKVIRIFPTHSHNNSHLSYKLFELRVKGKLGLEDVICTYTRTGQNKQSFTFIRFICLDWDDCLKKVW